MSQNPHIEAKVVEELDRLGLLATKERPQPREIKYEDLSKLTYLNLVIKVCHQCKGLFTYLPLCCENASLLCSSTLLYMHGVANGCNILMESR